MVMVIAECGVNHNGDEATAYKLIDAAVEAGADVAKFQLFKAEGSRAHLGRLTLPLGAYPRLAERCKRKGIKFACTAFDPESLEWLLANTEMAFVKISSGEGWNVDLIDAAYKSDLPIIQSIRDGGANLGGFGDKKLLHVVSEYPTPPERADLKRVNDPHISGLSDHSGDIFMSLAAVALGAEIIECHITLDKNQDGPDHKASLDPQQFKELVRGIRAIEKGLQ